MFAVLPLVVLTICEKLVLEHRAGRGSSLRLAPWSTTLATRWMRLACPGSLWIGLAAAAGMLYMVIRLRRYRDDT